MVDKSLMLRFSSIVCTFYAPPPISAYSSQVPPELLYQIKKQIVSLQRSARQGRSFTANRISYDV